MSEASRRDGDDPAILLAVLDAIEGHHAPSQRTIAAEVGIALGMANAYVKRCVTKGYVKLSQAPANRYLYYLTPSGLAEKTRLASDYLQQSLHLFRAARGQYATLIADCAGRGWHRLALAGADDMAEIALLGALAEPDIRVIGLIGDPGDRPPLTRLPALDEARLATAADAVLVTSMADPRGLARRLERVMPAERVLTPEVLLTLRFRSDPPRPDSRLA